jgi:hypothetical protein
MAAVMRVVSDWRAALTIKFMFDIMIGLEYRVLLGNLILVYFLK